MNSTARVVSLPTESGGKKDASAPHAKGAAKAAPEWVETPTSGRITAALSYAQAVADMAVIYGGAGVGKTYTARHYVGAGTNAWYAAMTPSTSGIVPCLEEVCGALSIPVCNGGAQLQRAIVRRLRDSDGLLIIDEAQHLTPAALDQLRSIYDAGGIGVALLGSREVYARMAGGAHAATLERLRVRIGKRLQLQHIATEDIAAFIDAWGVHEAKSRKTLTEIAGKPGGLRILNRVLTLAGMYADNDSRALSNDDIRAAWHELGGA